ncbi:ATP-binding protein [Oceanobacillus sp. Castelsardo]|uniref:ATP-binding protein n=1 Tax=Oceanobacillus sp. Castelsardo TaxID=1851204 RepID=UPI0009EE1FED|nr:ATP-binding protein [Oceanobacillus sp. Castelsardo]
MGLENVITNKLDTSSSLPNCNSKIDKQVLNAKYSMLPLSIFDWIENNQSQIVVVYDESGKIIFVSSSIEKILEYNTKDILGKYWYQLLTREEKRYISDNYEGIENRSQAFIISLSDKNGGKMLTECSLCKIVEDQKIYYVSLLNDITEQKEAEKLLIRSEKMSIAGQLAAGVAHEIRNPLTSIKGFLQLLQAGIDRKEEYYKIMIEEIEKMEKITSELLFISKPLTDLKRLESLYEMVTDTINLLQTQAKLKNIQILVEQPIIESIYCDKSQIKQVLLNIVKNAIEAMEEPGKITISVQTTNDYVNVHISDEGPGIPEEILHKLGEPFFTTKKNGTGLGIMICKNILEDHHGLLEIYKNKDKGSTFKLSFPKEI